MANTRGVDPRLGAGSIVWTRLGVDVGQRPEHRAPPRQQQDSPAVRQGVEDGRAPQCVVARPAPADGRQHASRSATCRPLREPYTVEMHHGALPSGTFVGHLLPGIAFMIWGVWWLFELLRDGPAEADAPVERSLFPPVVKMLLLPAAVWLEMPNSGWEPMDAVMGWHHATGYVGFGLSGVVDILARRGMLSARATYLALAAATLNAAVLFYGHGNSAGVEAVMHDFLMLTFMAVGVFALLEIAAPS